MQSAVTDRHLRVAININPTQLNPILAQNTIENFADSLIFDLLVTQDQHHHQIPDLARSFRRFKTAASAKTA